MKLTRLAGALALAGYALFPFSTGVQASETTLRLAHPWPAGSAIHAGLESWAQSLEQDSGGRIDVELYPAQTLTKAAKSYDAVVGQIADVAATVQGYTANRFPLTQVIELPGMVNNAAQGSCILQQLYDNGDIAGEYSDTHVLFVWTNGPGHLHLKGKTAAKPEDIAGLRIRRPTTVVGELLETVDAQPVGMPAPDAYQAIQRGVIDGVAISWDGAKVFRLNEVADNHTELNLYSLSFVLTMNKAVYDGLPDDLKEVVDRHSGREWSQRIAAIFDDLDRQSVAEAIAAGHQVTRLNDESQRAWQPVLDRVSNQYLDEVEARGLPAREVYGHARELENSCG